MPSMFDRARVVTGRELRGTGAPREREQLREAERAVAADAWIRRLPTRVSTDERLDDAVAGDGQPNKRKLAPTRRITDNFDHPMQANDNGRECQVRRRSLTGAVRYSPAAKSSCERKRADFAA